jgi:hypothetical protein
MSTEKHFEQFRVSFYSRNVMVYDKSMVYRTARGLADRVADDAKALIEKLKLPLTVTATNLLAKDSICIKPLEE